jgi:AcrR family transcriptional regulator
MTDRVLRADARRNRETVLEAATALFADRGQDVGMDEIADRAGLAVGTLYRHFADKRALVTAIVGRRFEAVAAAAVATERVDSPGAAFEALLTGYLEAAEGDAAFRSAILGPEEPDWDQMVAKSDLMAVVERIVARAIAAGELRADFVVDDFVMITRGVLANMTPRHDWRRQLAVLLDGVRPRG